MVIRADVCLRALEQTIFPKLGITAEQWDKEKYAKQLQIMDFAPCGQVWSTAEAKDVATSVLGASGIEHVAIFCARYEGIDQRFIDLFVHRRYSLGDYVLTNGDLAAMVFLDSSARFLEGILGNPKSLEQDSFEDGLLDAPCYAKPREFLGQSVPNVLLEGHHQKILAYQLQQKEQLTKKCRPDLWERYKARQ
jgi:tRNA (guanine37-N1)-methyltransferase